MKENKDKNGRYFRVLREKPCGNRGGVVLGALPVNRPRSTESALTSTRILCTKGERLSRGHTMRSIGGWVEFGVLKSQFL